MTERSWDVVDRYICEEVVPADPALEAAATASDAAGLPPIALSAPQGRLLHILARSIGAKTALEIGTLGGYSAICLGRALGPGGRLVSLEIEPRHAEVARANVERAGLSGVVDVRVGRALDLLPAVASDLGEGAVDLAFIDADKPSNPDYFAWAMRLVRPGGLVVVDNVVRGGAVADGTSADPGVVGTRALFEMVRAEPRAVATAVQTVGSKGYDGFLLAFVLGAPGV